MDWSQNLPNFETIEWQYKINFTTAADGQTDVT
jgi:hypothetical protein